MRCYSGCIQWIFIQNIFRTLYEQVLTDMDCSLKDLISGLSHPFRHLETYPSMLNELERGMHEAHPDRGDAQRAAAVFRDTGVCSRLFKTCLNQVKR